MNKLDSSSTRGKQQWNKSSCLHLLCVVHSRQSWLLCIHWIAEQSTTNTIRTVCFVAAHKYKSLQMDLDSRKLGIPHLQITVDQDEIQQGARKILKEIRPSWEEKKIMFKVWTKNISKIKIILFSYKSIKVNICNRQSYSYIYLNQQVYRIFIGRL